MTHFQLYIDGQFCEAADAAVMETQNPADGQVWASFAAAGPRDVERAVAAGRRALNDPAWRDLTQTARGKMISRLADRLEAEAETLGRIEARDSGKLLAETAGQARYVADYYRYFAGLADKIEGATLPIDKPDMLVYTEREPIGLVAAIVPWNAQMFLTATKLGPALAAGCTVIIKAAEAAPCTLLAFARLIDEAGFPPGVVSVITGDAEGCAIPLTRHRDLDRIAFTGGPETAAHVVRNSAENFAVTSLELGGKSPLIVFDDADLDSAVNGLIAGNFGASGQSCVAATRGLVQRSVLDQVVAMISERCADLVVGDPAADETQIGPLCTVGQMQRIDQTLAKAKQQGARIVFGGQALDRPGNYMAPTLVVCPNAEIETLTVEMFGPVMSLLAFDDEAEAIALANDSDYGLGSGVFTRDIARGHRVARAMRAGICWINTYRAVSPIAPFGGFNRSGYGREAGIDSIMDYTRTRTTWLNLSDAPMANPFVIR